MTTDPVLAYAGPESRAIDVLAIMYDGDAVSVRAVLGNFDTSAGEASAPFADAGPILWIAFNGDEAQIEFCQYPDAGAILHRRATKRERVSATYNTVKVHLSKDATTMPAQGGDFSPFHFSSRDFDTGS